MLYNVFDKADSDREPGSSLLRGDLSALVARGVIIDDTNREALEAGGHGFGEVANFRDSQSRLQVEIVPHPEEA